jgi:hypothetical protein
MTYTDPARYCHDQEVYERALVNAVDEMDRLFEGGYISYKACNKLFFMLIDGLYGDKRG